MFENSDLDRSCKRNYEDHMHRHKSSGNNSSCSNISDTIENWFKILWGIKFPIVLPDQNQQGFHLEL